MLASFFVAGCWGRIRGYMLEKPLQTLVEEFRKEYHVPGVSLAVTNRGALVHAAGYGVANLEHSVPATAETVYQSASVGKQFTAAMILLLVESGLLELDRPAGGFFEAAPDSWNGITIRHLLSHTGGLSDDGLAKLNLRLDYTDQEVISAIASVPVDFAPGEAWSYSNAGYILLGLIASKVTGRFYGELLEEWIFAPLGMNTARVIGEEEIIPNRAAGYHWHDGALRNQEYVSPSMNRTADGSLYLTVLDLAKWDRALYEGTVLSAASREAMWTPVRLAGGDTYPYGFGWSLASSPYGRVVEHDGEWQGFSSLIVRYVDRGVSIMLLANLAEAPLDVLCRAVQGAIWS